MGVYIPGMEMPKCCASCDVACRHYLDRGLDGLLAKICYDESRLPNCPLVHVPPHGRLIDESVIDLAKYEKAAHDALHNGKGSILYDSGVLAGARAITRLVRNAPTIIPADPEEEGKDVSN